MSVPKYVPRYRVSDYRQWTGDWELWNGIAVAMTPSPFGRHQWLAGRILTEFNRQLEAQECRDCFVLGETDWIISDQTVVRPDLAVVSGEFPEQYITHPPRLIVEVLSEGTAEKDRTAKFQLYQHELVQHYVIVDPESTATDVFSLRSDRYQEATAFPISLDLEHPCQIVIPENWLARQGA